MPDPSALDVILVNYRSAAALTANLDSVIRFVGPGGRLLVVNNSPEEDLGDILDQGGAQHVVITPGHNVGFARAVNEALAVSTGDLILLANPDARVISGSVSDIERRFLECPNAACVGVRLVNDDGSLQLSCKKMPTPFDAVAENLGLAERLPMITRTRSMRMLDWPHDEVREVDAVCGAFVFIRRAALHDVGYFDPRYFLYYEETDWMARAHVRGWKVLFDPAVTVEHVAGTSSGASHMALQLHLLRSEQLYIRKHFGRAREAMVRIALAAIEAVRLVRGIVLPGRGEAAREAMQRFMLQIGWPSRVRHLEKRTGA